MNCHQRINLRAGLHKEMGRPLYFYNKTKQALEVNYLTLGFNPYVEKKPFVRKQHVVKVAGVEQSFHSFINAVNFANKSNGILLTEIHSI
jgi:hypothetical protein